MKIFENYWKIQTKINVKLKVENNKLVRAVT